VLTGHTSEQISEWLRCKGGESIAQPKHLATARNTKWCVFSRAQSGVHCSVCTYVTWHPMSVPPTPQPHFLLCRACFLARWARAPRLAACHWSTSWAALVARLAEASRSLTACYCSTGWAPLAARLAKASRSLTAYCYSTDWVALAARMVATFVCLVAWCGSAGCAARAARMGAALAPRATCCCSTICRACRWR
jgi:hypothetical protein